MRLFVVLLFAARVAQAQLNYESDVKPVLRRYCFACHSAEEKRAGLELESFSGLLKGGGSGEIVKPGRPASSILFLAISHEGNGVPNMPLGLPKMPDREIGIIRDWIQQGLVDKPGGKTRLSDRASLEFSGGLIPKPKSEAAMPRQLPASATVDKLRAAQPVTAIAASPWAPLLAVAGHGAIALYNTVTREKLGELAFAEGIPYVLRFSRDGSTLLAGGGKGAVAGKAVLFDVRSGMRLGEFGAERDVVLAADVSADGKLVALGGPGKIVRVFAVGQPGAKPIYEIAKHTDWITALEFAPDGQRLATADRAGGVHMWEAATGGFLVSLAEHKDAITSLSWRTDGVMLATGSEDGQLILWDTRDGFPASTMTPHQPKLASGTFGKLPGGVLSVQFGPDGRLFSTGRDKAVRVYSSLGKVLGALPPSLVMLTKVAVSFDGKIAFAGDAKGNVHIWDGSKEEMLQPYGLGAQLGDGRNR